MQLANILTILLCGIAIALTSQRYVQQNQDHIALIRCLGASKFQILWAYIGLLCVVSAISIAIGSLLGIMMGYGLLELMLQLIPQLDLSFSVVSFYLVPYQLPFYQCNCATWIHFAKHLGVVKYSSHPCYSGTGKIPKIIILYVLQASPVLLFLA